MPVTLDKSGCAAVVHLSGEIAFANAVELKRALVEAIACGKDVHVDVENATGLDVAAMQLLWAAAREAEPAGRRIEVGGRVPEVLTETARQAGFKQFPGQAAVEEVGIAQDDPDRR